MVFLCILRTRLLSENYFCYFFYFWSTTVLKLLKTVFSEQRLWLSFVKNMGQSVSTHGKVKYSITRSGNILGIVGSVISLFKRQITNGGSVTITDKRIIRYFMTIPEALQLVLQSGAIANNGELFGLDMGKTVKIMDLAENMIRLSAVHGVEIVKTGLRQGEKLYEELLVKTEELDRISNSMIFIERDKALRSVVPMFQRPEEVNKSIN